MPHNKASLTKSYTTESAAKSAIKKQGLNLVPYRIAIRFTANGKRYEPVFIPELREDKIELSERGWSVE